jgi:hypothetical protein
MALRAVLTGPQEEEVSGRALAWLVRRQIQTSSTAASSKDEQQISR